MTETKCLGSDTHEVPADLFPYDIVREGQRQFLEDARSCMKNKINLLAHAPTGLGKTAVALTASLETSLESDGFVFFLTSRQSQHAAAVETLRHIWKRHRVSAVDMISREDTCLCRKKGGGVPCLSSGDCYFLDEARINEAADKLLEYPLHVQEVIRMCIRVGACPHHAAIKALTMADIAVCDYNQVFGDVNTSLIDRTGRKAEEMIMVVDEGHNLPTRIMENHSHVLTREMLQRACNSTGNRRFRAMFESLERTMDDISSLTGDPYLDTMALDDVLMSEFSIDCAQAADEMDRYFIGRSRHSVEDLIEFLANWHAFGDSTVRYAERHPARIITRFIEPSLVSSAVFDRVRCSLLMSGTLHPPEMFADVLGLADRCACRRYPSPFPPGNRLVIGVEGVSSKYDLRTDDMFRTMASKIVETCEATPGNVAAFFPSYDFMQRVEPFIRESNMGKRILMERREFGKNEKEAMISDLRRDRNALLMATIGGSFAEGVNFNDNLLSSIVVAGFPFSPPTMEGEVMKSRYEKRYGARKAILYVSTYPAVSRVLQAAGRAIRSEFDRAAMVLLDERYLMPSMQTAFPEDFHIEKVRDLGATLHRFHANEGGSEEGNLPTTAKEREAVKPIGAGDAGP
ncbi:MAG TPA: ATP-dependent DNA helicase [Methanomassiliicoccales archaeon]